VELGSEGFNGVEHTLADRHGGDKDDELGKSVGFTEFVNGAEIDEGLAGAGLHLDADVRLIAEVGLAFGKAVAGDNPAFVSGDVRDIEGEDIRLDVALEGIVEKIPLLAVENANHGVDGFFLVWEFFEEE
jgi:hypothetical protein